MLNPLMSKILALAATVLATSDLGAQVRIGGSISIGGPHVRSVREVVRPIHHHRHVCVQGHWQTVEDRVWVEGSCNRVWVAPTYREYLHYGHRHRVLVTSGYWRVQQLPGHWETRCRRVWVAGCGCRH